MSKTASLGLLVLTVNFGALPNRLVNLGALSEPLGQLTVDFGSLSQPLVNYRSISLRHLTARSINSRFRCSTQLLGQFSVNLGGISCLTSSHWSIFGFSCQFSVTFCQFPVTSGSFLVTSLSSPTFVMMYSRIDFFLIWQNYTICSVTWQHCTTCQNMSLVITVPHALLHCHSLIFCMSKYLYLEGICKFGNTDLIILSLLSDLYSCLHLT